MRKSKNYLKDGLKSDRKLKNSVYRFLYEKHFDWAIILAAFFAPLPYISSKNYWFLIIKVFDFALIFCYSLRYIQYWKQLQSYYDTYEKANDQGRSMVDKGKLKGEEFKKYEKFNDSFISHLKNLGESFKTNKDSSTFQEYAKKNPDKIKPLEDLLNDDKELTKTAFGVTMNVLTSIFHFRGIPRNEIKNYRRLLYIILLVALFFLVYAIELYYL
ncbi:MAG: hypothetical protein KKF62_15180 [Bacteroidetes bacterium]|nr:hypothetical protein [Bacteroidota bacterium]MBU1113815.1 hypothetical protein [Bacteroidota bacterium]MBU1799599.1 hypothetical protein [Bacteroidota bacterium]